MRSESVINQAVMKRSNRNKVVLALWNNSPISRTGLAKITGLNKATITGIIASLEEDGMITVGGSLKSGVGRAQNLLMFNEQYGLCAGLMFRSQVMKLAISNAKGKILWKKDVQVQAGQSPMDALVRVSDELERGLEECSGYSSRVIGIGVGAGSLLRESDDMLYAIHSTNWYNIPVVEYLRHRFSVPVIADTGANNALLAEKRFGVAREASNVVYLLVGYGIGGGIMTNGRLYRGDGGFAGDIGHYVLDPNGPLCPCGKRGCWEVMASSIATGRSFDELAQAADSGDGEAIAQLSSIGRNLGAGIANLIHILNPQMVVLGGPVEKAGDWVMNPCRNTVKEKVWPWVWERTRIEYSILRDQSYVIGAITRVIELLFE